jgi:pimeloyl-ACP methyl ester carboxylesterase
MKQAYRRISSGGKVLQTALGAIEYTEFGQGSPVLIVHGSGGGYDQGEYFARLIGGNFHWIAPSRFGFLKTPVPNGASSEMQADAHTYLLDALGIERAAVVGISGGGPSALLFAQRYPKRTTCLVMGSAVSHLIPPRPTAQALVFNAFLNNFVYWSIVHTSKSGLLAALGVPVTVQKELPEEQLTRAYAFLEQIMPMGARRDGQLLEQHMSAYDTDQIHSLHTPTLVVHARDDTLVPFDHAAFTAQKIPESQVVALEKGGHLALLFDINAGVRATISKFLERYGAN